MCSCTECGSIIKYYCVQDEPALYHLGSGPGEMLDNEPINDIFSAIPIDKQHQCENGMIIHVHEALGKMMDAWLIY